MLTTTYGRRALALILLLIGLGCTASAAHADTIYAGQTSPQDHTDDGVANGEPKQITLSTNKSAITALQFSVTARCEDGSFNNLGFHLVAGEERNGITLNAPITNGRVDATFGQAADDGNAISIHLVANVTSTKTSGTITLSKRAYSGGSGPSGPLCTASLSFSAKVPPAPKPEAGASLAAGRFGRPGNYDYYLVVERVICAQGANRVRLRIMGRPAKTLRCSARNVKAITGLHPGRRYSISLTPMRVSGKQVVRGKTLRDVLDFPAASSPGWKRVS